MLDGKRLIELPDKEVSLVKLQFTLEERDIYKMVGLHIIHISVISCRGMCTG